ncbi:MAG TPA: hypothetical protein VHU13_07315 [Solirubrobacteraceae bacterium]|nr:hypothetical protein [Solirubrobacteraceae bacterium]
MSRSVLAVLAVGLTAIVVAVLTVLSHRPLVVVGSNAIAASNYVELEDEKQRLSNCQAAGLIPSGTTAIRVAAEGIYYSPPLTLQVLSGNRVVREATHPGGGPPAPNVTVGVASFASALRGARICLAVGPTLGAVRYSGKPSPGAAIASNPLGQAELHVEYLRPGTRTWASLFSSAARDLGYGKAPSGAWVAYLVIVLMLLLVLGVGRLVLEELR